MNNFFHNNHPFNGTLLTAVFMILSAGLNLLHLVTTLNDLLHIIASCATIGAACTTIMVGALTIKKLKRGE